MAILLVITALLPLSGALVLFAAPRLDKQTARAIALATALLTMVLSFVLVVMFRPGVLTPQFAFGPLEGPYGLSWLGVPDIRFALGLDGLSLWLFALTTLLMLPAIFASWESIDDRPAMHYALHACPGDRPAWGSSPVWT